MRSPSLRPVTAAVALIAAIVMGCQGSGGGDGGVTPPTPGITVSLSATNLTVVQGQSGTVTTTITRVNGFTGDIDLTVENAPAGVTPTFTPAKLPNGSTSSSLQLAAAPGATPGPYTLTIRARGAGVTDQTVALSLAVGVAGSYNLSVSPATVTVQQGSSGATTVTIERIGGFAGAVTLTVTGAPAGVTVDPSPVSLTGNSVSLVINAAPTAAVGTSTLTVHGTAGGLSERTATFSVQVTATTGTSVTVKFCGSDIPTWVGAQSEGGPWAQVQRGAGNSYVFSFGSRGAVAAVTPVDGSFETAVIYASTAELVAMGQASVANCVSPSSGSKHLTGTVANVGVEQIASISLGEAMATVDGTGPTTFALDSAPDAPADLIAARHGITATGFLADKLIIRRGFNLPSGSAIPVLDFAAAEAIVPIAATATLTNLGSDSAQVISGLITATKTAAALGLTSGTAQQSFGGVPTNQLITGDLHELIAFAVPSGTSDELRGVDAYFHVVTSQTLALGPPLAIPTVSATSVVAPQRWRAQLAVQGAYSKNFTAEFSQSAGSSGPSNQVTLYVTSAYLGGSPTTWDVTIPDMSAAGFNATWGLVVGTPVSWSVTATNSATLPVAGILPADGTQVMLAIRSSDSATLSTLRKSMRRLTTRLGLGQRNHWPSPRRQ